MARTLAERNSLAIAAVAPTEAETAVVAGELTMRVSVYATPQVFVDAKSAHLVDFLHGLGFETHREWFAAALQTYADQTTQYRHRHIPPGRGTERRGITRSWVVTVDAVDRMRDAIRDDARGGRRVSQSTWAGEALTEAIAAARTRCTGEWPEPPARLPNRMY